MDNVSDDTIMQKQQWVRNILSILKKVQRQSDDLKIHYRDYSFIKENDRQNS